MSRVRCDWCGRALDPLPGVGGEREASVRFASTRMAVWLCAPAGGGGCAEAFDVEQRIAQRGGR